MNRLEAEDVIRILSLAPHPEGGHYRETFRDVPAQGGRGKMTSIYFLLAAGQASHWHRVDAAEMWHYYAGAPLWLRTAAPAVEARGSTPANPVVQRVLGPDLGAEQRPQLLVEKGDWQSAETQGKWTLVGCTVTPAFEFAGFELAPPGFEP